MPELADGRYVLSAEAIYAMIWVFTVAAIIATFLRLGARAFIVKALGLDDFLIICSIVTCVAISTLYHWHIYSTWEWYDEAYGSKQSSLVDEEMVVDKLQLACRSAAVTDNSYILILPIAKCSILAFYRRISPSKKHRYMLYAFGFVLILQAVLNVLLRTFSLDPPSAWWNCLPSDGIKVRYRYEHLLLVNSSFHVLADLIILALPIPVIYRMKLSGQRKAGLIIIYLLSFLSLGATLARLAVTIKTVRSFDKGNLQQLMAQRIENTYWAIIEVTTIIICANLPTMPVLVHNVKPLLRTVHLSSLSSHRHKNIGKTTSTSQPVPSQRWYHGFVTSYIRRTSSFSKNSGYNDKTSKQRSGMIPSKEGHSTINIISSKEASVEMESIV